MTMLTRYKNSALIGITLTLNKLSKHRYARTSEPNKKWLDTLNFSLENCRLQNCYRACNGRGYN